MGKCGSKPKQKTVNGTISGNGGAPVERGGRMVCLVAALDYTPSPGTGYDPMREMPLMELSSTKDGTRFAALAKACGAEVYQLYDKQLPGTMGWPSKDTLVQQLQSMGSQLGEDDTFIFFYGGHGMQSLAGDDDGDEADGQDEELCLVNPDGSYCALKDDEIAQILLDYFDPGTKILFVTDCCQSGTVCDLSKPEFADREIAHMAGVKDSQYASDWGDGGGFTICLMETIEDFVADGRDEFSIVDVHNEAYGKFKEAYPDEAEEIQFCFEQPVTLDPDTFVWPLVPPEGWSIKTMLDQ